VALLRGPVASLRRGESLKAGPGLDDEQDGGPILELVLGGWHASQGRAERCDKVGNLDADGNACILNCGLPSLLPDGLHWLGSQSRFLPDQPATSYGEVQRMPCSSTSASRDPS